MGRVLLSVQVDMKNAAITIDRIRDVFTKKEVAFNAKGRRRYAALSDDARHERPQAESHAKANAERSEIKYLRSPLIMGNAFQ
jgi:hypothetical protein